MHILNPSQTRHIFRRKIIKKLIFKADKGTMGRFNYIGFRKYVGKNPVMGTNLYDNHVIIDSGEYIELGFIDKPNVANWKNKIDEKEFKGDTKGTLLGSGEFEDIELWLNTYFINLTPVED